MRRAIRADLMILSRPRPDDRFLRKMDTPAEMEGSLASHVGGNFYRASKVLPFRWARTADVCYRSIGSPDSEKSIISRPRSAGP